MQQDFLNELAAVDLCTEHNNDFYRSLLLLEKSFS